MGDGIVGCAVADEVRRGLVGTVMVRLLRLGRYGWVLLWCGRFNHYMNNYVS